MLRYDNKSSSVVKGDSGNTDIEDLVDEYMSTLLKEQTLETTTRPEEVDHHWFHHDHSPLRLESRHRLPSRKPSQRHQCHRWQDGD